MHETSETEDPLLQQVLHDKGLFCLKVVGLHFAAPRQLRFPDGMFNNTKPSNHLQNVIIFVPIFFLYYTQEESHMKMGFFLKRFFNLNP